MNRRIACVLFLIVGLSLSFWLVSRYPALNSKAAMSGMEAFEDQLTHQPHFHAPPGAGFAQRVAISTLNWYETNWRGMAFGLALAGGFLTLLGYLPRRNSGNRVKNSLMGLLVGTPLGVCVNCVAPIAKGIYDAGSRMETALAVMFSSPTLNIVILTMVFSLFPLHMALIKVAGTLLLVLVIVPLISRGDARAAGAACELPSAVECAVTPGAEPWMAAVAGAARDYLKSLWYIVARTVPLMLLAGFLGALLSHAVSFEQFIGMPVNWKTLGLISFMGTFLPLPIAFDIMLAQAMKVSGLASGFVMTLLFTLGTFSIYSALVVYRTFSLKVALQLYFIVAFLGMGLGYGAHAYSDYQFIRWLEGYNRYAVAEAARHPAGSTPTESPAAGSFEPAPPIGGFMATPFLSKPEVEVQSVAHRPRDTGAAPFSRVPGPEAGLSYVHRLGPENFFDPFFFGKGLAAGDLTGDGWDDLVVATGNGFEVYQNMADRRFRRLDWPLGDLAGKEAVNVALVDMNNDGRLDIFVTTFGQGNYLWLMPESAGRPPRVLHVPNGSALLTNSVAFGDLDGDGFPDLVHGNYFLGVLTRTPLSEATDQVVLNRNLQWETHNLPGIPGQTQTSLLSDIDGDGVLDLMIGNDYRVSDTYYRGLGGGRFDKITRHDGRVPVTTENTMSMDTGDFNNDLIPDLYLANIGFSKGIDVVSNIFGQAMKETGRSFCDTPGNVLDRGECRDLVKLVTLLNPERQDVAERCVSLEQDEWVAPCMASRLALLAVMRKDESLCGKISVGFPLARTLCSNYFQAHRQEPDRSAEIPFRSLSNILLEGSADGKFRDVSGDHNVTTAEWSWNARFADLDNDEWQDLYVVNGVLITQEFASNNFFHNQGGKTFTPAQKAFGLEDFDHSSSYVYIDIDNDGDLDIVTNTLYGAFKLYVNHSAPERHSITFRLQDEAGNRFCIGCRIVIHYGGGRHQMREIKASGGFRSFEAPAAHFGLAGSGTVDRVEVRWSDGATTVLDHAFPADHEYRVRRRSTGSRQE